MTNLHLNVEMPDTENPSGEKKLWGGISGSLLAILIITSLGLVPLSHAGSPPRDSSQKEEGEGKFIPPKEGTWRFIVSGDSRNCGDVVVPAIATNSAERYRPSFYWHLGDLRAIYKIDEDMAGAAQQSGMPLSCQSYLDRAWPDFIEHQIEPFGSTPFYLGIGNHEVIRPRTTRRGNLPRSSRTGY